MDTVSGEKTLLWIRRPDHHMDVGMVPLVMEGGTPAKLVYRDLHGLCQPCLVLHQERAPLLRIVIAKGSGVLPAQGVDDRPDRSLVLLYLPHSVRQRLNLPVTEQAVVTSPFHSGTSGDVLEIDAALLHGVDIGIQRHGEEG